jgi:hypothetical protein
LYSGLRGEIERLLTGDDPRSGALKLVVIDPYQVKRIFAGLGELDGVSVLLTLG